MIVNYGHSMFTVDATAALFKDGSFPSILLAYFKGQIKISIVYS
jgi:hypothetical protein